MPDVKHVHSLLSAMGIASDSITEVENLGVVVRCEAGRTAEVLDALAAEFPHLVDLFGIDTGEAVDVVYMLRSFERNEDIRVYARHEYDGVLASVWQRFPAALMPERECAEMFGLSLSGHPNPKHLLLTSQSEPLLLKRVFVRGEEEVRNR